MLLVLLFNLVGYRLLINEMQDSMSVALERKVDRNEFDDHELITIKTKLNLPYYNSSPEFERVYGSININGVDYEYVKRRVYKDTLELLCLPNETKTRLETAKNDFLNLSLNGQPANKKSGTAIKINLPDFCQEITNYSLPLLSLGKAPYFLFSQPLLAALFKRSVEQPPEA